MNIRLSDYWRTRIVRGVAAGILGVVAAGVIVLGLTQVIDKPHSEAWTSVLRVGIGLGVAAVGLCVPWSAVWRSIRTALRAVWRYLLTLQERRQARRENERLVNVYRTLLNEDGGSRVKLGGLPPTVSWGRVSSPGNPIIDFAIPITNGALHEIVSSAVVCEGLIKCKLGDLKKPDVDWGLLDGGVARIPHGGSITLHVHQELTEQVVVWLMGNVGREVEFDFNYIAFHVQVAAPDSTETKDWKVLPSWGKEGRTLITSRVPDEVTPKPR